MNPDLTNKELHANICMGLAGEVGEYTELIKKALFHGRSLDRNAVIKELGDIAFYLASACSANGLNFGDVLQANVDKLKARYPEGFSAAASEARVDCKE
jgi:NTP pyrophosphatase (non-canonical NTP hydrolase)